MDLNARPLRCFLAVADLSSFSHAATRLNISQPALSATIKELERQLGFSLFDRGSRHVHLSPEGRQFLAYAQRYVRENTILRQAWQEIRSNDLRVSSSFHTALVDERNRLISGFLQTHDECHLQVLNDEQERGLVRLDRGEVDLVVAIEAAQQTCDSRLSPHDVSQAAVERLCLAIRPVMFMLPVSHELARTPELSAAALAGHEIVVPNRYYGAALSEHIRFTLTAVGAKPVRSPEGNSIGVELYGAGRGLPAVSLDWYRARHVGDAVVYRTVESLGRTQLSLIRSVGQARSFAKQFWDFACAFRDASMPLA